MGRRKKEDIEKEKQEKKSVLHGDVKRGAISVFLFALAIIVSLGFFGQAEALGDFLNKITGTLFGWGKWLVPFVLIGMGVVLLFRKETLFYISKILGLTVVFLTMLSFFHIYFDNKEMLEMAKVGSGGGYIGFWISILLVKLSGKIGGSVILFALLISGFIVAFNFSLVQFIRRLIRRKIREASNDNEEDEDEDEDDGEVIVEHKVEPETVEPEKDNNYTKDEESNEIDEPKVPLMQRIFKKEKNNYDEDWVYPPLNLFEASTEKAFGGDVDKNSKIIQDTLRHFGIEVEAGEVKIGPTVTQYSFKPAVGVKLERITALNNNLALALAAHSIRIEAPIPGKALIGIEVPNKSIAMVRMRELFSTPEFENRESNLLLALGKDVNGNFVYGDLKKMPHLLIAGSTGAGKSVCVNTILLSLLYQNSPENLKLILVDPKRVELSLYNGIPHLLSDNVIVDNGKVLSALKWAVGEMTRRYKSFEQSGSRDIISHNKKAEAGDVYTNLDTETNETIEEEIEKVPYIVIVIDELADLMSSHGKEVEGAVIRLAQMARATGIHLIVSTQKPVVTVITGLIKSNIATRIAFRVPSLTDSRTILDSGGAEKLLGNGDMLFSTTSVSGLKRLQGVFVAEEEIKEVVSFIKKQKIERGEEEIGEDITNGAPGEQQELSLVPEDKLDFGAMTFEEDRKEDVLYEEAKKMVIQMGKASTSLLQRRLGIGYARAARLIDMLEEKEIVGPSDGAKAREILVASSENVQMADDMKDQIERDKWQM